MSPQGFVVDASVALKWFTRTDEEGIELALAMIGTLQLKTTTLAIFEIGSRLARSRENRPDLVAAALRQVREICGDPVDVEQSDYLVGATLARKHDITFYDASYAAIAQRLGGRVVSADRDLLEPGLAVDMAAALKAA